MTQSQTSPGGEDLPGTDKSALWDHLTQSQMLSEEKTAPKVFVNNEFIGHYPVSTAAVVMAETPELAAQYLSVFLREKGLPGAKPENMREVPFMEGQVEILADGNY